MPDLLSEGGSARTECVEGTRLDGRLNRRRASFELHTEDGWMCVCCRRNWGRRPDVVVMSDDGAA